MNNIVARRYSVVPLNTKYAEMEQILNNYAELVNNYAINGIKQGHIVPFIPKLLNKSCATSIVLKFAGNVTLQSTCVRFKNIIK